MLFSTVCRPLAPLRDSHCHLAVYFAPLPWPCQRHAMDPACHIEARYYCIDKPIPSAIQVLSDDGQTSNDEVANPLAWQERQAVDGPEIRAVKSLDSASHPCHSQP